MRTPSTSRYSAVAWRIRSIASSRDRPSLVHIPSPLRQTRSPSAPLWHAAPPRRLLYLPLLTSATPAFEPAGAPRTDLERTWRAYVQRIAAADQAALAALYDATNRLIYGMALRILGNPADAEEVTLDIYTQVWRSASNFDERRGSVVAWLMTMARSRAIDRLRSGANRSRREESLIELDGVATGQAPMHLGVEREVQAALRALAPEQREAIELAYWYGYSHAELAARLGQPLGTVKTRIRMGMMKLRSQLGALS